MLELKFLLDGGSVQMTGVTWLGKGPLSCGFTEFVL